MLCVTCWPTIMKCCEKTTISVTFIIDLHISIRHLETLYETPDESVTDTM